MNAQKIKSLRKDGYGDYSLLATQLLQIIKDGPDYGIHSLIHIQNYNQLMEIFDSKILNEFENQIILKDEDVSKYVDVFSTTNIKDLGTAYLKTPKTEKSAELIKLYQKVID